MTHSRRSYIEIVADTLQLLRLGPAINFEIMQVAHISADQLAMYLFKLQDAGIIDDADPVMELPAMQITNKGLTVLDMIERLREMIPPEGSIAALERSKISSWNFGEVLVSKGVAELANQNGKFAEFVDTSLQNYRKGEWGEQIKQERRLIDMNVARRRSTFSSYEQVDLPEIWITTTADRLYTAVMFPSEQASTEPMITLKTSTAGD